MEWSMKYGHTDTMVGISAGGTSVLGSGLCFSFFMRYKIALKQHDAS